MRVERRAFSWVLLDTQRAPHFPSTQPTVTGTVLPQFKYTAPTRIISGRPHAHHSAADHELKTFFKLVMTLSKPRLLFTLLIELTLYKLRKLNFFKKLLIIVVEICTGLDQFRCRSLTTGLGQFRCRSPSTGLDQFRCRSPSTGLGHLRCHLVIKWWGHPSADSHASLRLLLPAARWVFTGAINWFQKVLTE